MFEKSLMMHQIVLAPLLCTPHATLREAAEASTSRALPMTLATTGRQPCGRVSRLERTAVGTPATQWLPLKRGTFDSNSPFFKGARGNQ